MNATFVHDRLRASCGRQRPRGVIAVLTAPTALVALLTASPTGQGPQFPDTVPECVQQGRVSWYGPGFHGRRTANGEIFDTHGLTMAHRSLPLGTSL